MLTIAGVLPGSPAARRGVVPGDRLLSINGSSVRDSIDYQFLAADERLELALRKANDRVRRFTIRKSPDDPLGLTFLPLSVRRCRNKCVFCFVDQMPSGCRKSLYVKDDDYRASFQFGNYITLGNLQEEDWERIFRQRLSPLYISVHATEPDLRRSILNNHRAPDILASLRRLAGGGIRMHTQIVLCPGINDGDHLNRTIRDLAALFPAVQSIAVVPVGLTVHREGLYPLRTFRRSEARTVVSVLEALAARFKRSLGSRLVFASDEFYLTAGLPIPMPSFYEDFPQLENGVGMVALFQREARRIPLPKRSRGRKLTAVTGGSFAPLLRASLRRVPDARRPSLRVIAAKNRFFGASVTVAGLLTGSDILQAIKGARLGEMLLIPASTLKDDGRTFLDGLTIDDLERAVNVPVRPVQDFNDLAALLSGPPAGAGKKPGTSTAAISCVHNAGIEARTRQP